MKREKLITLALALTLLAGALTGCGNNASVAEAASADGVKTVQVGYVTNAYPLAYEDENGNLTGYELETLKLVDEALPQYEFAYSSAAQDALYTGLGTGKYDFIVTNSFYTKERAEKYVLPENPIGASLVGLVVTKDRDDITGFADAAAKNLSLAPILAGDGLYYVVDTYNNDNPDAQLALEATDNGDSFMNAIGWVAEGRYDTAVWPKNYWEQVVEAEDGSLHEYASQLKFIECKSVYTYTIVSKGNEQIAADISVELGKLKDSGKLSEFSKQFYGYDAFAYDNE